MSTRTPKSPIKPWQSALVFFDKGAKARPLEKGMVRVKASIDHRWTGNLKKNYQQNNVILELVQDSIGPDGSIGTVSHSININGKYIDPDDDGRFYDVAKFILVSKGIADKYGNLLDRNGNVVASRFQQIRWSGAPPQARPKPKPLPPVPPIQKVDDSGNISEGSLTKEALYDMISEELNKLSGDIDETK